MLLSRRFAIASIAAACLPLAAGAQSKGAECSQVKLTTSMGPITIALNKEKAPVSVDNFQKYVKSGHYNGTIFHRVMDGFMIQGGGFDKSMAQKPTGAPIKNEAGNGLKNEPYSVAMARTGVRDSATSQFFINVVNNERLNYTGEDQMGWGYAVFGKVVAGQDTVEKIRKVPVGDASGHQNVPKSPIVIEKAECA